MVRGYRPPLPVIERLANKTVIDGDCWRFTGAHNADGYGLVMTGSRIDGSRRVRNVHQVAYEELVGPVPDGLELDHVYTRGCRFRDCWRPEHLEPVTHWENTQLSRKSPEERARLVADGHRLKQAYMARRVAAV
jgi:hypothetical protein